MKSKKATGVTVEDVLILMVRLYSLCGDEETFSSELEDRFKSLLAENLVAESDHLSEQLQDFGNCFTLRGSVNQSASRYYFTFSKNIFGDATGTRSSVS